MTKAETEAIRARAVKEVQYAKVDDNEDVLQEGEQRETLQHLIECPALTKERKLCKIVTGVPAKRIEDLEVKKVVQLMTLTIEKLKEQEENAKKQKKKKKEDELWGRRRGAFLVGTKGSNKIQLLYEEQEVFKNILKWL
jgi:hypothetical protein